MKILCNGNSAQYAVSDSASITIEDDYTLIINEGRTEYVLFVTKKLGGNIVNDMTPPIDFAQNRYLIVDNTFVQNPNWTPSADSVSPPTDPLRQ